MIIRDGVLISDPAEPARARATATRHIAQADSGLVFARGVTAVRKPTPVTAWKLEGDAFVQLVTGATVRAMPGDYLVFDAATGKIDVIKADHFAEEFELGI